jgi:hypothetical protein
VRKRPVGYQCFVWGGEPHDPDVPDSYSGDCRWHGWKVPFLLGKFGRNEFRQASALQVDYRNFPEGVIAGPGIAGVLEGNKRSGQDGLGRMGADMWPVFSARKKDAMAEGFRKVIGTSHLIAAGRYVDWGGLGINTFGIHYVIGPGEKRPVPTARFEMFRECLQECEARIFLEKMLTDPALRAKVGEEKAEIVQELIDTRTRVSTDFGIWHQGMYDRRGFVCSGWQERSRALYETAAEIAKNLGVDK